MPGTPLSGIDNIYPHNTLILLRHRVVPRCSSVVVAPHPPLLLCCLWSLPLIALSRLVHVLHPPSYSPVVAFTLIVTPLLSLYMKRTRWVRFSLVNFNQFWLDKWLFTQSSCVPITPWKSRRDCDGLLRCRLLLGSLGWGIWGLPLLSTAASACAAFGGLDPRNAHDAPVPLHLSLG